MCDQWIDQRQCYKPLSNNSLIYKLGDMPALSASANMPLKWPWVAWSDSAKNAYGPHLQKESGHRAGASIRLWRMKLYLLDKRITKELNSWRNDLDYFVDSTYRNAALCAAIRLHQKVLHTELQINVMLNDVWIHTWWKEKRVMNWVRAMGLPLNQPCIVSWNAREHRSCSNGLWLFAAWDFLCAAARVARRACLHVWRSGEKIAWCNRLYG